MYKTILVNSDIEDGRRVLRGAEKLLRVAAAFWFHADEEDWKLVIVSPDVEEQGPIRLYTMLRTMLSDLASDPAGVKFPFGQIMLVSPNSMLYKGGQATHGSKRRICSRRPGSKRLHLQDGLGCPVN
jgi:hypothetical protein